MRQLPLLALLLLPFPALAQFGVSSIDDPIRPDRTPLAAAEEVPFVLLLGLEGTSPLFVNPARTARARGRFVYGTIRQPGQTGAPVSFTGLFGTRDRRWLITADNSIVTRNDTERSMVSRTEPGPAGGTVVVEDERVRENVQTLSNTRARLLLIGRTDFGGYAFGLFGGFRRASNDIVQTSTAVSDVEGTDPPFANTRRQTTDQARRQHRDDYGVGAEVALAGRTWDLATSVSYQRRDADAELTQDATLAADFVDGALTITERRRDSFTHSVEGTPEAVAFEVIGALRAGLSRDDYLFGYAGGTFGGGTADYGTTSSSSRTIIREIDGEVVADEQTSNSFEDAGDVAIDTRATRVSLGYVYAQRGRGLTVLAAVNPTADFERVESASAGPIGSLYTSKQDTDRTLIALNLPLYVRFDVTKRLEAFGGGVYTYTYDRTESAERPLYPADLLGDDRTLDVVRERTSETFSSSGRLFAGAVMTFRSGLTAQAAFRGDFAQFSGWTVSLGYRF